MTPTQQLVPQVDELIWKGRVHLGDEAGIYGDAHYSGLCFEWPVTLRRYSAELGSHVVPQISFVLEAEDVLIFDGFPGHQIVVTGYMPSLVDYEWSEMPIEVEQGDDRLRKEVHIIRLKDPSADIKFCSVRIRIDTRPTPNLYNNIVLRRLALRSPTHYSTFGFYP